MRFRLKYLLLILLFTGRATVAFAQIEFSPFPLAGESIGSGGNRIIWGVNNIDVTTAEITATTTTTTTTASSTSTTSTSTSTSTTVAKITTTTTTTPTSTSTTLTTTTFTTSTTTTMKPTTTTTTTSTTQPAKERQSNELVRQEGIEKITDSPLTYPSPFSPINHRDGVKIQYTLSSPLDVDIYIYSPAGELIKKFYCSSGNEGGSQGLNKVSWDGNLDTGGRIGNGTYLGTIISKKDNHLLGKFKLNVFD